MNRYSTLQKWILRLVLVLVAVIGIIWNTKRHQKESTEKLKEYPGITRTNLYCGVIVDKEVTVRGKLGMIELNNGTKFTVGYSRNYNYLPFYDLSVFLQKGDSIYKGRNNDTIFIFRKYKKHIFIIGDKIQALN